MLQSNVCFFALTDLFCVEMNAKMNKRDTTLNERCQQIKQGQYSAMLDKYVILMKEFQQTQHQISESYKKRIERHILISKNTFYFEAFLITFSKTRGHQRRN